MEHSELTDYKEIFRTEHAGRSCTLRVPVREEPDAAAAVSRLLSELLCVENAGESLENGHNMQKN